MDMFIYITTLFATVAFSISGAVVGVKKEMDIFGVTILGLTTAIAGGLMRDALLGIHPATTLVEWEVPAVAIVTALIFFIPPIRRGFNRIKFLSHDVVLFVDSIGLGLFSVIGVQICVDAGYESDYFLQLFMGVITAVGGGVLRDIMANNIPNIFVRHFYASASLIGSVVCIVIYQFLSPVHAMIMGAVVTIILRILASHFKWNLPRAKNDIKEDD